MVLLTRVEQAKGLFLQDSDLNSGHDHTRLRGAVMGGSKAKALVPPFSINPCRMSDNSRPSNILDQAKSGQIGQVPPRRPPDIKEDKVFVLSQGLLVGGDFHLA